MKTPKKENFLYKLYESNKVSDYYKTLQLSFAKNYAVYKNEDLSIGEDQKILTKTIIAFPQFLEPEFINSGLKVRHIIQKKLDCFGIILDDKLQDIDSYLREHFSKNSRTPIIKKKKRLEECFNIEYKIFYGEIDVETYHSLMNITKEMLIQRFEQKSGNNSALGKWKWYEDTLYRLINEKKASFFVIYNNQTPIQISINYHYDTILFAHIPAYDINYSKFGLGNTAVYKQLEWAIENNYKYLDFGDGDLDYKRRWCNYDYKLETQIICKKSSLVGNIVSLIELNLVRFKNLMKDLNVDAYIQKLKQKGGSPVNSESYEQFNFSDVDENFNMESLEKINLLGEEFNFLKKPIFDFIYQYQDHFDSIKVYKENDTTFVIAGEKNTKKLILE